MSLRKHKKHGPAVSAYKTCNRCGEEFPKDKDHFYPVIDPRVGYTKENPGWSSICIPCDNKRTIKYKKSNPEKVWKRARIYNETPRGFIMNMWNDMKKSKDACEFKSFDEVWEHWEVQKKTYGMKCPYLGIEMTMVRGKSRAAGKFTKTPTNVSRDKILPGRPYNKQNLVFVSWKANNAKHSITPKIARRFLSFVKERYGTEDIE